MSFRTTEGMNAASIIVPAPINMVEMSASPVAVALNWLAPSDNAIARKNFDTINATAILMVRRANTAAGGNARVANPSGAATITK